MLESFWGFVLISTAVIVTPGPDTAVTIRSTLLQGRACGLATAIGVASGQMIWAAATSVGLVAVLLASEPVFNALRLAGAAYLIWLGVQTLWSAWTADVGADSNFRPGAAERLTVASAFSHGLLSDLGNPKMAVFFASVLPQFATPGDGMMSSLMLLGLLFSAMTLAWLSLYAAIVASAGDTYRRSKIRRTLENLMGVTLVGMGVRVACEQK